jgi:hypothetical protein
MSINWQDVITSLAVATGGGLVLVGAWAWLIKTAIPHKLATEADTFKTRIKADADIEIERLKSSLQIVATEHQVRFTKLHEKRAEIIADLSSWSPERTIQTQLRNSISFNGRSLNSGDSTSNIRYTYL